MILLDVNVVVGIHRGDHVHHQAAFTWFDGLYGRQQVFGVPAVVWASFVRLTTNPQIFPIPTPIAEAFDFIAQLRDHAFHLAAEPGPAHIAIFDRLCRESSATGDLVADAYLASIAVDLGAEVATFDRDFARFPGLRWTVPAAG